MTQTRTRPQACTYGPCLLLFAFGGILAAQSLKIIEPKEGTEVHPGQTLTVVVEASPPRAFQEVIIVGQGRVGFSKILFAPPYRFSLPIPLNVPPRRYTITADGTIKPGEGAHSEPVEILVERSDSPLSLTVQPSTLSFRSVGDEVPLDVIGQFIDFELAHLNESRYVLYTSDDPSVATVTKDGHVKSIGQGAAKITVSYRDKSAVIAATVGKLQQDRR